MEWFADGLTFEEAAAMVALTAVGGYFDSPELYQSFLEDHYVQSKTVPLPLSGMINIDLVSEIEDYIRRIEDFLGSPFPTSDIILLVFVPDPDSYRGFYAAFATHYMYVAKGSLSSLPHEPAHYYTAGPRWLVEGGAEFISNHLRDLGDGQRLGERLERMSDRVASGCVATSGIENLFHYERHRFFFPLGCVYSMGEHFLLGVSEAIGYTETASVLGALSLIEQELDAKGGRINGQMIYNTFLNHTPPDRRDAFIEIYQRLHGGPNLSDVRDDHGDSVHSASRTSFGEPVQGVLDYRFDVDFFRFHAEEGRKYQIDVEYNALRATSVWVYNRYGFGPGRRDPQPGTWEAELGPSGPRVSWVAPQSGTFYAAVENFRGQSGPYAFTITPIG